MTDQGAFAPLTPEEASAAPAAEKAPTKVPIVPVPEGAPELNFKIPSRGGAPTQVWAYRNAIGQLLGYDGRFEFEEGGRRQKEVRPITYCQVGDKRAWRSKAFPAPRPLYGLDRLATRPDAPVIVVEGCKCADAAEALLPGHVAVTWQGGGEATGLTDWTPLSGRKVTIWPDRDRQGDKSGAEKPYAKQPGTMAALRVASHLQGVAGTINVLNLAELDVADGWDVADAADEGWSPAEADLFLAKYGESAEKPVIYLEAGRIHVTATEAEDALIAAKAPFYVRASVVRPVVDEVQASHGKTTKIARLVSVRAPSLIDHLSRSAEWRKWNARANAYVPADPPVGIAEAILARDGEWKLPPLIGVITTPTLRPDGTLLVTPGYDAQTRLLLLEPPPMPAIPPHPTRADAERSLALLAGLLAQFPFVDRASRSVALSALITPVVRGAMPVAPLHATTAHIAGSGKSFLIDVAAAIQTGDRAPAVAAAKTDEEMEKRLNSSLLGGQSIISIDNVNGQLGGDFLCQLIERPVVSVRRLGVSEMLRLECRASVFASGNNIQIVGDMTRRVLLCSLDPNMERPELRTFSFDPFETVLADRGKFVAAALTVVRAYIAAGFPGELPPLASFGHWSRLVRSALVWLGQEDPCVSMEAARADDPIASSRRTLFHAWSKAVGQDPIVAGKLKQLAETRDTYNNLVHHDLNLALNEIAAERTGGISAVKLGIYLARNQGVIMDGLKLTFTKDTHASQKVWRLVSVGEPG